MQECRVHEDHRVARALLARFVAGEDVLAELDGLLRTHFEFEEETILPILSSRLSASTGPLPVIREDHVAICRLLDALAAAPTDADRDRLATLLPSHFEKEEELLLPFARTALSPEELARIGCPGHVGPDASPPCEGGSA